MKSVEYIHIQFGQLFTIGFALTYFDKNITCVNQVPHTGFSPNTCMVVPWGIISKDLCITSAIVDTQI